MTTTHTGTLTAPTTVAVGATETTLLSYTRAILKGARRITVQVYNTDPLQSFVGIFYRRQTGMSAWAVSPLDEFSLVPPSSSLMADVDVEGTDEMELRGRMSGAGGSVQVATVRKGASP